MFILQEDEQVSRQDQARGVVSFDEKLIFPSEHRHGDWRSISRYRRSSRSSPAERNILLQEKQLKLWGEMEKNIYKRLKTRRFILTPIYDPALLQATGMNAEFETIFKALGWESV